MLLKWDSGVIEQQKLQMNKFAGIIVLLAVTSTLSQDFPTFDEYLEQFNKTYLEGQYKIRKVDYDNHVTAMKQITAFTTGVNEYTDWNDTALINLKATRSKTTDAADVPSFNASNLATTVDWRNENIITPVKNQDGCGSGWAFALTGYMESRLLREKRYSSIDLSEQTLVECTSGSSCTLGYIESAFRRAGDDGVPTEIMFPYFPFSKYPNICSSTEGISVGSLPINYYDLTDEELMYLVQKNPIAITISAAQWEYYSSGIMECKSTDPINHAALLVGYTEDYWIVKNSWGDKWGENGYIRISRVSGKDCSIGNSAHEMSEWRLGFAMLMMAALLLALF